MDYGLKPLGREKWWLWLMLLPTVIGLLFGTIGSLFATLGLSFFNWDLINPPTWAGTENYVQLFQNKDYIGNQKVLRGFWRTSEENRAPLAGVRVTSAPSGAQVRQLAAQLRDHLRRKAARGKLLADQRILAVDLLLGGIDDVRHGHGHDEAEEGLDDPPAELLKVIEEGEFYRVGGTRPIKVDVRFIAATNQNVRSVIA